MSALSEAFSANLSCNVTAGIQLSIGVGSYYYTYNFLTRTMACIFGQGVACIPFSELDRETLEAMHAKYIERGGKLPLPPSTHATLKHNFVKPGQG